eukprot:16435081-Heterocapsa_arctica.AAC.1
MMKVSSGEAQESPATGLPGCTTCWQDMPDMQNWKWSPCSPTSKSSTTMSRTTASRSRATRSASPRC